MDLSLARPLDLDLEPRTQALGRQLLGAPPKAPGDVGAVQAELPPFAADAANDDVRMRVVGVVVIDRRPLDGAPKVGLDTLHQVTDVDREIEIPRVLRRHDEPELVPLADARLLERLAGHGALGAVEDAWRAVLLDAVALDVLQVPRRRLGAVPSKLLHVGFDDDAARALPRTEAGGRREARRAVAAEAPVSTAHERRDAKGSPWPPDRARDRCARTEVERRRACRRNFRGCSSETLPIQALGGAAQPLHAEISKGPKICVFFLDRWFNKGLPLYLALRASTPGQTLPSAPRVRRSAVPRR